MSADQLIQNVLSKLQHQLRAPEQRTVLDQYAEETIAFFQAIDWSQSWLLTLMGFHATCLLITLLLRNRHNALSVWFFVLLGMAALTEPLNTVCSQHWQTFASTNYFDESGMFIVTLYSFPLVFNGFVAMMFVLKAAAGLLIQVKRKQLKNTKKKTQ
ncbi:transmembrane protein 18-domain-containing protein [Syncephalastrum racemosum]|uniref:Transmembrane protein 18-domain-containing protein n=1 Tax=Syncephalastrum racemosum TaxID=13706 RepID=A0A1X2HUW6_SYNRA|nr:transmembrane protein 18-domain-containing protein [Syncephalastrum racemosum]